MNRSTLVLHTAAVTLATALALAGVAACTSSEKAGGFKAAAGAGGEIADAGGARAKGAAPAGTAGGGGANKSVPGSTAVDDLVLGSAKIRNAQLVVSVKRGESVAAKANSAEAVALQAGGEVDVDERTSGTYPQATLVLRIPPDHLSQALDDLSKLGTEKSRHLTTQDVTAKVADVTSRVNSARVAIARLRALYQHATKVADVITIESELSGRESDLESLQAQQRSLTAQTATATVTLTLTSLHIVAVERPTHKKHRSGFVGGLQNGWDAFSRGAYALSTALGAVLPFALLLLVIGIVGRLLWPRLRPVRRPAPIPAGPPVE